MLSFYNSKVKLTGKIYGMKSAAFDLPAGHSCPMADACLSRVVSKDGHRHIEDFGQFRCYATKAEVQYPNVYNIRHSNLDATKDLSKFTQCITDEIIKHKIKLLRVHSSGDFYNFSYFMAWYRIAQSMPDVIFFAYSKQASFVKYLLDNPLDNFKMTYSHGGKMDAYAIKNSLPTCYVAMDYNNPIAPIICTGNHEVIDFEYIMQGKSFSILIH